MNVDRDSCLNVIVGNLLLILLAAIGISSFIGGKAILNYSDPPETISSFVSFESQKSNNYTPEIIIVPGFKTEVTVEFIESIQGAWSSPDLVFILKSEKTGDILLEETLSKKKYWSNMISSSNEEEDEIGKVSFTLEIPPGIKEQDKLTGRLVGEVVYPVSSGKWTFDEKTKQYQLIFDIQIIPESTYNADYVSANRTKVIGSAITLMICLPLCFLLLRYAKRNLKY